MRSALIIGNTEYTDPGLAQLTAPGKDAEDFARVLKDVEIGAFDDVVVLLNQPEPVVRGAIDEFFDQKRPDDLLVFYFSGHGVRDELGALYLAVKNTIRSRLRSTAVKSDYIREAMDQSRSRRQVLILDCCNSGAFAQGTKAETGGRFGTATAFEGGFGRIILTASDSTQFAWEGDKVIGETDNSLFTHYLVEGLEGEADLDGDGRITVDELYDYTYEKVKLATPKQTPSKFSTKQQGEIILRQNIRVEDIKPVALPVELMDEIEDTRPYVREAAVQKLAKILKGRNLALARSAREALAKFATDDDSRRVSQVALQVLESFRLVEEKAEAERKAREEAERLAALKDEEERLMREKEAAERRAKEETEKLQLAKAQREAAEREAARLKAEREAAEKAALDATEKAEREKKEKEIAEREAAHKAEQEAIRVASQKKAEREAAEKAESEAEQLVAQKKAERKAKEQVEPKTSKPLPASWLKPSTIGVVVIAVIVCGFAALNYLPGIFDPAVATEEPGAEGSVATEADCSRADTFCVGLVTDVGKINDKSFNQSAWEGVQQAESDLGAKVQYIETADSKDYAKNIATFADEKYDVIVTVGFGMGEATVAAAATYPEVDFIGVDQFQAADTPGVVGLNFPEDNAGFLVGALAAMMSENHIIGAVCGTDVVPPVWRFGEGYKAGAAYADGMNGTTTFVFVVYHSDVGFDKTFTDPEWGAQTAQSMMDQGADAIFGCGGITGNGAITQAAQAGKYAIGVDTDQYLTLPEAAPMMLSSAMKLITPGVFNLIKTSQEGNFPVGNFFGDAGYAPYHDLDGEVPSEVKEKMEEIYQGLLDGTIRTNVLPAKP